VARILIADPSPDVAELLVRLVQRVGHDAVRYEPDGPLPAADLVLVEPGCSEGRLLGAVVRTLRPETPLVCVSIYPRTEAVDPLAPDAYLVKPFAADELWRTIDAVLRHASRPAA
jgi:hypothetical protein